MDKDRYAKVYAQIEQETERYLRENTLCEGDIDRYGFGKHILRLLMSGLAMHAMGGLMGGTGANNGSKPPVSGDFEKLHPRGQSQNAGQFAEKPGKGASQGIGNPVSPKGPKAGSPDDLYNQAMAAKAATDARSEKIKQNFGNPSISTQQPMDATTAAVAEKWHGDKQEPESPRNYPDNLNKPPEQQTPYAPPERTIEPTDDDLTAMKEDPYNYDPEQAAEPAPAAQAQQAPEAPPTAQPQPDEDTKAQQQAEARAKRNAEHAAKLAAEKAAKPTRAEQKQAAKRVEFDPSEWENDEPVDAKHEELTKPKASDFEGDEHEIRMSAHDARQPRRESFENDEDHKAAHKKWKQDAPTFENATKKYNQQRGRQEASISRNTSANHVRDQALEHDLDHDELHSAVSDELKHALPTWHRSEEARKHFTTSIHGGKTKANSKSWGDEAIGDETNIKHLDEDVTPWAHEYPEIAGEDPHYWAQKAREHVMAGPQPKPGHHNLEFVSSIAKRLASQRDSAQHQQYPEYNYPEPEDGAPFSRKALTAELDRYFNEARNQYRKQRQSLASAIWTDRDRWL